MTPATIGCIPAMYYIANLLVAQIKRIIKRFYETKRWAISLKWMNIGENALNANDHTKTLPRTNSPDRLLKLPQFQHNISDAS